MNVIGIIPARLGATRFPRKPLAPLLGMPMLGHCYHRTRLAKGIDATYVATCDEEIAAYVRGIGGEAVMTADTHTRATTRSAEAMGIVEGSTGRRVDVVVMVQGDEPLIHPDTIAQTLGHFADPAVEIVNIMSRIRTREQFEDPNNVKVVVRDDNDALYFSREPIPSPWHGLDGLPMFMQTGIIAFRREVLLRFIAMPETRLEQIESVDMNRVLETGGRIRMVPTEAVTIGVDTPEELVDAERVLATDPVVATYLTAAR
jgi:3-deoxy-manno-octulosonate cytidylyltransferase (CMP-KDO synthetase)